ncbi:MAG: HEAT repeat domain-containing protein [Aggregatilineales bacterium]
MTDYQVNIWRMQTQGDTQGLIAALSDDSPTVRRAAAAALRTLGVATAVPHLRAALARETDLNTRLSLFAALRYLQQESSADGGSGPKDVDRLVEQLRSGQPARIIEAAEALGRLQNRLAVGPLVVVFNDAALPGRVRLAAARALLAMNSAPAVVTLLAALDSDDWRIRRNGLAVLGHLRADWAVDAICAHVNSANEIVRRTARAALRRIGTPEALAALAAADSAGTETAYRLARAVTKPLTAPDEASAGPETQPPPPDA